jgi:hypothetical protein
VVSDGRRQFLALRRGGPCRQQSSAGGAGPGAADGQATAELDALCQPVTATRVATFNPIHPDTADLFAAVLSETSPSTGSATGTARANSTLPRPQMARTPSGGLITRHA